MGDFFCRRDNEGREQWWLEIIGKGDKQRLIPATNEMMAELAQYRRSLNLPPSLILMKKLLLYCQSENRSILDTISTTYNYQESI